MEHISEGPISMKCSEDLFQERKRTTDYIYKNKLFSYKINAFLCC